MTIVFYFSFKMENKYNETPSENEFSHAGLRKVKEGLIY